MWRLLRPDAATVLSDRMARKSLGRYFDAMHNRKAAKFVISKRLPAEFAKDSSVEQLWQTHDTMAEEFYRFEQRADAEDKDAAKMPSLEKSYLDLKIEIANRIMRCCHFCARRCGVDRFSGKLGYCGCGAETTVSSIFEHVGEEPELVPSGTIFTMGCTMRCKHCQNYTISQWMEKGRVHKSEELAKEVERLRNSGCRNANLVGGEPTPWLRQWFETFKLVNVNVPIVWNSNAYYSPETARLLAGFADVYLLDFKYGPGDCAERISEAQNYWEMCTRNHLEAKKNGELIVRVLVLPNHLDCCVKPILKWIVEKLGAETRINIMFQYRPEWQAHGTSELGRRLSRAEMEKAVDLAEKTGLANFIT